MQEQLTFKTEGDTIHCSSCENRISSALGRITGIIGVQVSSKTQEIQVRFDSAQVSAADLEARLSAIGFPAKRVP